MCQCHMSQIYFCFSFLVCTLFHPHTLCAHGKLNFIHESLRHISWRFLFLFIFYFVCVASFCSLAAETLFFFRHSFVFPSNLNTKPHPPFIHLTETKMYVRAKKQKQKLPQYIILATNKMAHTTSLPYLGQSKWHFGLFYPAYLIIAVTMFLSLSVSLPLCLSHFCSWSRSLQQASRLS